MSFVTYEFWDGREYVSICPEADSYITPFFRVSELACKTTGEAKFHPSFLPNLSYLRWILDHGLNPTNCCRSQGEWQSLKDEGYNPHPKSLHLIDNAYHPTEGCMAVDISTDGWSANKKQNFMDVAWKLGWSLGIAENFIHIDRRVDIGLNQTKYYY